MIITTEQTLRDSGFLPPGDPINTEIGQCQECFSPVDALVELGATEERNGVDVCRACLVKAIARIDAVRSHPLIVVKDKAMNDHAQRIADALLKHYEIGNSGLFPGGSWYFQEAVVEDLVAIIDRNMDDPWIKTTDRMPEADEDRELLVVMAVVEGEPDIRLLRYTSGYACSVFGIQDTGPEWVGECGIVPKERVTHWRHKPALPEVEQAKQSQ